MPGGWVYTGGEAGARALLGAVASSTIGVAGTTFSITVAALSLASGQMGPRLLRNFVRDSGNQYALGIFLGTFAYALVVLRTVRSVDETTFVPHLGVTGGAAPGPAVRGHPGLVRAPRGHRHQRRDRHRPGARRARGRHQPPRARFASGRHRCGRAARHAGGPGRERLFARGGRGGAGPWAEEHGAILVLLVRPGDYLFPGAPVAELVPGQKTGMRRRRSVPRSALGSRQAAAQDLEFAVRQLVEIALRALSPGINDPFTAIAVLDRLGAALCEIAPRHLAGRTIERGGRVVLHRQVTDYAGLCDAMFHMIRQSASGSPAVLIRLLETLGRVMTVETRAERRAELLRHAELTLSAGRIGIKDPADIAALEARRVALPGAAGPRHGTCP